mgnify:CR=1 FL=1
MDFVFQQSVVVHRTQYELFKFFADAENLNLLTPPWLHFQFLTGFPIDMGVGVRLAYKIKLHMIPIKWESEITEWDPPNNFTDVQRKGPYKKWVHSHIFQPHEQGTTITDRVAYQVLGGRIINWAFVARDLKSIFDYRRIKILELFP